jgi:hypothetical protein
LQLTHAVRLQFKATGTVIDPETRVGTETETGTGTETGTETGTHVLSILYHVSVPKQLFLHSVPVKINPD